MAEIVIGIFSLSKDIFSSTGLKGNCFYFGVTTLLSFGVHAQAYVEDHSKLRIRERVSPSGLRYGLSGLHDIKFFLVWSSCLTIEDHSNLRIRERISPSGLTYGLPGLCKFPACFVVVLDLENSP